MISAFLKPFPDDTIENPTTLSFGLNLRTYHLTKTVADRSSSCSTVPIPWTHG